MIVNNKDSADIEFKFESCREMAETGGKLLNLSLSQHSL